MLILPGSPALSAFRLDKLAQKIAAIHPAIRLLYHEFLHFASLQRPLSEPRREVLASLLTYGPGSAAVDRSELDSATTLLVVPRPGTISPWSSKATDLGQRTTGWCSATSTSGCEAGQHAPR